MKEDIKNAELHADFRTVEKKLQKIHTKKFFLYFETFWAHLASKFAKSAKKTPKKLFLKKIKKDIKKRRISC